MQVYFGIIGMVSILYYFVIIGYTKRWNSTFSGFWAVSGVIHLSAFFFYPIVPMYIRDAIMVLLIIGWSLFITVETQIIFSMCKKTIPRMRYIIVLGAQVRGTKITNSLMRRIDCAYEYVEKHPSTKIIVSGGQGKGETISEADAMFGELLRRGCKRDQIIKEDASTSTWENLLFCKKIIADPEAPIALVSNNFHVYRALLLGKTMGYTRLYGLPTTSNPVLFLNYMVREFFGVVWFLLKYNLQKNRR